MRKAFIARLVLFVVLWLAGCSFFSEPIDISGLWVGSLLWTDGPAAQFTSPIRLDLIHMDRDLTGTVTVDGPGSEPLVLEITDGYARTVSMSLEASGAAPTNPPQDVEIELEADFLETQMSGTGAQTINGRTYHFTWEAVLVAPAVPPAE